MTVVLRQGESQEQLLRRFSGQMRKSGVLSELKKRRWAMSKGQRRAHKDRRAARRRFRREKKARERERRHQIYLGE